MIEHYAALIPNELKDCSGSVFYSGRAAFTGIKRLYILGFNPGGDPIAQRNETIRSHTQSVLKEKADRWSEYSCESWKGKAPSCGGIQPRVIHLIQTLGFDPCDIPASNAIFVRTKNERSICSPKKLADLCWPVHQEVIANIQPCLILCMGRRAQNILQHYTKATTPIPELTVCSTNSFLVEVFKNSRGCRLAAVKHPSRCDWSKQDSDPSTTIRTALNGSSVRWSPQDVACVETSNCFSF